MERLARLINEALDEAKRSPHTKDLVELATHLNVKHVVKQLREQQPILAEMLKEGKITITGAYYDLDSGKVEWLK